MKQNKTLEERFWENVTPGNSNECWEWQGNKQTDGYGRILIDRKYWKAHRLSYFLHYQVDPEKLCVCHSCDNPSCVNPSHLWLGTHQDNIHDRTQKRRSASGAAVGFRKLTSQQVEEVRQKLEQGQSRKSLSVEYKVNVNTIGFIATGNTWKWLDGSKNISSEIAKNTQENREQLKIKALELRQLKLSYLEIAKIIGCSQTTAYRLITGKK